jgi:hypothetical protein
MDSLVKSYSAGTKGVLAPVSAHAQQSSRTALNTKSHMQSFRAFENPLPICLPEYSIV